MYGGGGASAVSQSQGNSGVNKTGTQAVAMGLQVALQAEMQKAQIDALNAQTLKTNAETAKTATEVENKKSETELNGAKLKETLKNIDAIEERIRASKVETKEKEFKNEILEKLKNSTIFKYVNGKEQQTNYLDLVWENEIQKVLNEKGKLNNEEFRQQQISVTNLDIETTFDNFLIRIAFTHIQLKEFLICIYVPKISNTNTASNQIKQATSTANSSTII